MDREAGRLGPGGCRSAAILLIVLTLACPASADAGPPLFWVARFHLVQTRLRLLSDDVDEGIRSHSSLAN